MHADPQSLNPSSNVPGVACGDLVLDCDFCGQSAEAAVTHQGTGKRWNACMECIDMRRMRRLSTPYSVEIIQNATAQPPTVS